MKALCAALVLLTIATTSACAGAGQRRDAAPAPEGPVLQPRFVPGCFTCSYVADFTGAPGAAGEPGNSGRAGRESMRLGARAGESGWNGTRGADGAPGARGEDVAVRLRAISGERGERLLEVAVTGPQTGREERFVIDPAKGRVVVRANGGAGGAGGRGGDGGDGGSGTPTRPGGDVATSAAGGGGHGGDGGRGGDGGDGGRILVIADAEARALAQNVHFDNRGGPGGPGGLSGRAGRSGFSGPTPGFEGTPGVDGVRGEPGKPGSDGPPVEWRTP